MAVALFGGSFDPPHIGHFDVAQEALKRLEIEKLIVLPAFLNPFKSSVFAPASLRLEWLRTLFLGFDRVEVSSYEIEQNKMSYTIESVKHFAKLYNKIYFIIGADNLNSLEKWHKFDELNSLVTWVVAHRDDIAIKDNFIALHVNKPISSTHIRTTLKMDEIPLSIRDDVQTYYKGNS